VVAGCVGAALLSACWTVRGSHGGGETHAPPASEGRFLDPSAVALPPGYRIEVVAARLDMPTGVAFDDRGGVFVVESGLVYEKLEPTQPRLLQVFPGGGRRVVAEGTDNGPWNGVAWAKGRFFVAEGGSKSGGRILVIDRDGRITPLVEGLPSFGDHHTNGPVVGADGFVYFGQGTATNSGVVGPDNHAFGWLPKHPEVHDIPCRDVKLRGTNFESNDPGSPAGTLRKTGAYVPYGTATTPNQIIAGKVPCNGAVLKVSPQGGAPELVAWGFRNPYGLAFGSDGQLWVTDNGYDIRGSRPVYGAGDLLWKVTPGRWYGWPDFVGGRPTAADRFAPPGESGRNAVLLAEAPNEAPWPTALFGVHSSSNGLDISRSAAFGYVGEAFVAQFGDMAPQTGKVFDPVGFKVVRVDVAGGGPGATVTEFATNRGSPGPASYGKNGGLERPIAVRFDPSGGALYVVDYGIMTMTGPAKDGGEESPVTRRHTGALWKISRVQP
jgi:glucose/arabinose dehydrogenase